MQPILDTLDGGQPTRHRLAIDRRLSPPSRRAATTASCFSLGMLGRPRRWPFARARASPARTRSRISARSNSENTPSIWNIAVPAGVLLSRPCWCRYRPIRSDRTSWRNSTRSFRLRPSLSTDQQAIRSNRRREGILEQPVQCRAVLSGFRPGDSVVRIDLDDLPPGPDRNGSKFPFLILAILGVS